MLGNGSNELLELIIHAFLLPGTHVVTSAGTFIVYRLATKVRGREIREVPLGDDRGYDLKALAKAVDTDTRLVFIANPNNPTGTHVNASDLDAFIEEMDGAPEKLADLSARRGLLRVRRQDRCLTRWRS